MCSEEYTKAKADEVFGIKTWERKDEKLYDDYETEKAKEVSYTVPLVSVEC